MANLKTYWSGESLILSIKSKKKWIIFIAKSKTYGSGETLIFSIKNPDKMDTSKKLLMF